MTIIRLVLSLKKYVSGEKFGIIGMEKKSLGQRYQSVSKRFKLFGPKRTTFAVRQKEVSQGKARKYKTKFETESFSESNVPKKFKYFEYHKK